MSFQRQYCCKCHFGTQVINGYVDFLVSNEGGYVTLFEDKLKIVNDSQLEAAIKQAKSYALMLGVPSFIVASPEGMKLFSYDAASEELVAERKPNGDKSEEDTFVEAVMRLQKR